MNKRVALIAAGFLCALTAPATHALEAVGDDDFRISQMGPDGSPDTGTRPFSHIVSNIQTLAYNAQDGEYLVVYAGDTADNPPVDNEIEIFGRRLDAATGSPLGGQFRLTTAGPEASTTVYARAPALAHNSARNQYLLVFESNAGGSLEIWGQRLAAEGTALGSEFKISGFIDLDGQSAVGTFSPDVAYNPNTDEYLVVWQSGGTDGLMEIYARRVRGVDGAPLGTENFPLSTMGPDGNPAFYARAPAVAVNAADNQYLVVWEGQDDRAPNTSEEIEIFAQRLDAAGAEIGADDFPVSDMGALGVPDTEAYRPRVAYNPLDGEYLVVWEGNEEPEFDWCGDNCLDTKFEIYGQRLTAGGAEVGNDDFLIGTWDRPLIDAAPALAAARAPVTDPFADAVLADVAFDVGAQQYAVVWNQGDYRFANESPSESGEIFAQAVSRTGEVLLPQNLAVSAVGFDGVETGSLAALAARTGSGEFLVVFGGRGQSPLDVGENEAYGQRLAAEAVTEAALPPPPAVGPNPFSPRRGAVSVQNAGAGGRVRVYDFAGEKIRELVADAAGDVQWDGRNDAGELVASGTYFFHFDVGDRIVKVGIQN